MKKTLFSIGMALAVSFAAHAGNTNAPATTPPKPDLLKTCPVSGDKLGEDGPPYVFTYKGQQVKLCCEMCKPDFDKNPAKYIKKIRAADPKAKGGK